MSDAGNATGVRIGIDVGGTFTDLVAFDAGSGRQHVVKTPSTPAEPHRAVLAALDQLRTDFGVPPAAVHEIMHGTTIGVNTLLQRSGAKVGLLVTEGFRDLLTLGRARLPDVYNYLVELPVPLTARRFVKEIRGRRLADGTCREPLDEAGVRRAAQELLESGVDAVAICFLHSYKYPEDELRAAEIVRETAGALFVCASSEVWPEMREYERAMVALINCHVGPGMERYYTSLLGDLHREGITSRVYSTKSNGGIMSVAAAQQRPVETLLSGPAAGVVAARYIAHRAGFEDVVAIDMGGTSTEAAIIRNEPRMSTDSVVGDFHLVLPTVDVQSLGAGGGSIAWLDSSGVLKVGPRSAGSDPGPACYGLGGREATITDAYLELGILHPDRFLGGKMPLHPQESRAALAATAALLGEKMAPVQLAEAILHVATSNMYAKLIPQLAQAGVDRNQVALVAYGGAGPTHAFLLAREVGIDTVIVPPRPGTLCALGALVADVKSDFIRSVNLQVRQTALEDSSPAIAGWLASLGQEAQAWLDRENRSTGEYSLVFSADMRYAAQAFTIEVPLDGFDQTTDKLATSMVRQFETAYVAQFGIGNLSTNVDLVNLRVTAVAPTQVTEAPVVAGSAQVPEAQETRDVYLDGGFITCAVYERDSLGTGGTFAGPAIIAQYDTTTFVPPGFTVTVDPSTSLIGRRAR
ncbi:hydantoinase/oxoprolinase family protein [Amycolatopsis jejuensis]|uniref:hydantoinase/oxoprolinase family protein n=1 Tax=Amycolatopsis jejuensis TaxID=330084 RepID=UPI000524651E|nr:hydantoinase/oxoprolinase family protein [Amycolatopsis jejuensis]